MIAQSKKIKKIIEGEMFFGSCESDTKDAIAEQICVMVEEYDIPEVVAIAIASRIVSVVKNEYGD